MKTGELAERLGIHPNTVRLWSEQYAAFLSEGIRSRTAHTSRDLSDHDSLVIASIAHYRRQGLTHEQIAAALADGRILEDIPALPSADEKEARKAVELIPLAEYHRALDRLKVMQDEINRLIDERDTARIDRATADQRIAELREQLGDARGQLRMVRYAVVAVFLAVVVTVIVAVLLLSAGR